MVATCGGVFFGVAVWVALTGGVVWLVAFLLFRYASRRVDRRGHLAAGAGRRLRLSDPRRRLRRAAPLRRSSTCTAEICAASAPAPSTASGSGGPRVRRLARPRRRRRRALGRARRIRRRLVRLGRVGRRPAGRDDGRSGPRDLGRARRQPRHVRDGRAEAGRRPRVDLDAGGSARTRRARRASTHAVFPAGTCADISFVRLPQPASSFVGATNAFNAVETDLATMGFGNLFKKYLVYYDGPSVETDVCGTGGGTSSRARPSRSSGSAAARTFRPTRSRRTSCCTRSARCPRAQRMHAPAMRPSVRLEPKDVLYPVTSGAPLAQLVLDVNHDDYYAHSEGGTTSRTRSGSTGLNVPASR